MTVPLNVSLSWSTVPAATSYTVQVSNTTTFGTTVFSQSGLTVTSSSAAGLANSTTYYWRSAAANSGGSGPWSAVWTFGTIFGTPGMPILSVPANGTTVAPQSVSLSWGSAASASTYNFQVSTTLTFAQIASGVNGLIGTATTVTGLTPNTTYYWRVDGANTGGTGMWSGVWSFTTLATGVAAGGAVASVKTAFSINDNILAYTLGVPGPVEITFSDLLGRVELVVSRMQASGSYALAARDCGLTAGKHIIRFRAPGIDRTASLVIAR
jgi:hypothetical protein